MGLKRFEMICLFCLNDNQHLLISGTRRLHHSIKPNKKEKSHNGLLCMSYMFIRSITHLTFVSVVLSLCIYIYIYINYSMFNNGVLYEQ